MCAFGLRLNFIFQVGTEFLQTTVCHVILLICVFTGEIVIHNNNNKKIYLVFVPSSWHRVLKFPRNFLSDKSREGEAVSFVVHIQAPFDHT